MLLDPEPKVPRLREIPPAELVLLDFQPALEDLLGFGPADGDVHGDFFVTPDTERADCVPRFGGDGRLPGELFEDFGGSGEAIAGFADGDVCVCVCFGCTC